MHVYVCVLGFHTILLYRHGIDWGGGGGGGGGGILDWEGKRREVGGGRGTVS